MAKKVVVSGIMAALTVMVLYLSNFIPTSTIFLFCFSTVFIAVIVIECGIPYAMSAYAAVALLGFLILPNKFTAIGFAFFFGFYPVLKYWIEKHNRILIEWATKLVFFNVFLFIAWCLFQLLFVNSVTLKLPIYWLVLLAQGVFIIYDVALSLCISFYIKKIKDRLRH